MAPRLLNPAGAQAMAGRNSFGELGLSIIGLGAQYPPYALKPSSLEALSKRFYPESPS